MTKNVGSADKTIRIIVAIVALILAFVVGFPHWGAWVLLAVAAIALLTAAIGWCPLYLPFGISTCKSSNK